MGIRFKQKGNFNRFGAKVNARNQVTLDRVAKAVKQNQFDILLSNVIDWTGNLAGSIYITKHPNSRVIGPDENQADYAKWIEHGATGSSFKGYHYVRNSLRNVQMLFRSLIKKDIERRKGNTT